MKSLKDVCNAVVDNLMSQGCDPNDIYRIRDEVTISLTFDIKLPDSTPAQPYGRYGNGRTKETK